MEQGIRFHAQKQLCGRLVVFTLLGASLLMLMAKHFLQGSEAPSPKQVEQNSGLVEDVYQPAYLDMEYEAGNQSVNSTELSPSVQVSNSSIGDVPTDNPEQDEDETLKEEDNQTKGPKNTACCRKPKQFITQPSRLKHRNAWTLLASSPGSGNTWTRLVIEEGTRIYTGSVYHVSSKHYWTIRTADTPEGSSFSLSRVCR